MSHHYPTYKTSFKREKKDETVGGKKKMRKSKTSNILTNLLRKKMRERASSCA
jgi:hypothetical protein